MSKVINYNFEGEELNNVKSVHKDFLGEDDIVDILLFRKYKQDICDDPKNPDEEMMIKALMEINAGIDSDQEVANFLDNIDSVFTYHKDYKKYSPRETVCSFMNTICEWSIIFKNSSGVIVDDSIHSIKDLYKQYENYCYKEFGFGRYKILTLKKFKAHLRKHAIVKERNEGHNGMQLRHSIVVGLPQKIA